jgi:hypothetical protein
MIHWTTDFDAFGMHKAQCGVRVSTKEVESQRFEGVFRFSNKAYTAVESKNTECPDTYCRECWLKAVSKAKKR